MQGGGKRLGRHPGGLQKAQDGMGRAQFIQVLQPVAETLTSPRVGLFIAMIRWNMTPRKNEPIPPRTSWTRIRAPSSQKSAM
jgi:hypothetical protein